MESNNLIQIEEVFIMNDGKFEVTIIDKITKKKIEPIYGYEAVLMKLSNGEIIPEEEPVFFLRGRDKLALELLELYFDMSAEDGCTSYQLSGVRAAIDRFIAFKNTHADQMKQPGCTRGV